MGLGKAGANEANKSLIYEQVKKRRFANNSSPQDVELDDASFADAVPRPAASTNADVSIIFVDPFVKDEPCRGHAAKLERLTALRARITAPCRHAPYIKCPQRCFTRAHSQTRGVRRFAWS